MHVFFLFLLIFKSAFLDPFFSSWILEAVGKILLPNSYTSKVFVFLVISLALQLAIFSKIVIRFLHFSLPLPDLRMAIFKCSLYIRIPCFPQILSPKKGCS